MTIVSTPDWAKVHYPQSAMMATDAAALASGRVGLQEGVAG